MSDKPYHHLKENYEGVCDEARRLEKELVEARAKLAEYERWHGEAREIAKRIGKDSAGVLFSERVVAREKLVHSLTAAHARGYAAGVEAEREECAKVAASQLFIHIERRNLTEYSRGLHNAAQVIAAAIRNRSAT